MSFGSNPRSKRSHSHVRSTIGEKEIASSFRFVGKKLHRGVALACTTPARGMKPLAAENSGCTPSKTPLKPRARPDFTALSSNSGLAALDDPAPVLVKLDAHW